MMNKKSFATHLGLYGSDFARWDRALVKDAQDLLAASAPARDLYKQHQAFEAALNTYQSPSVPDDMTVRASAAAARYQEPLAPLPLSRFVFPALIGFGGLGFAAAAIVILIVLPVSRMDVAPQRMAANNPDAVVRTIDHMAAINDAEISKVDDVYNLLITADNSDVDDLIDDLERDTITQPVPDIWTSIMEYRS